MVLILYSFYHDPPLTSIVTAINNVSVSSLMSFISTEETHNSHLGLRFEYELHTLRNTNVSIAQDPGKAA